MPCNRPLPAWRTRSPNSEGRFPVTFTFNLADQSLPVAVPCGRCMGCRLEKSRAWAMRMLHEAKLHKHNHFITLTYSNAALPLTVQGRPTLRPEDFVLFMKRLRQHKFRQGGPAVPSPPGIRYYQCGEYGETTERPHHHAILFNCQLPDLKPLRTTHARNAHALYASAELEKLWQQGMVAVGAVTFETAAYVASYVTKKILGPTAPAHYGDRVPEYSTMSRRPGIGRNFLEKYGSDIYPSDEVIIRGHPMRPPKYYDRILEREDPETYYTVRDTRILNQTHYAAHNERQAREANVTAQLRKRDSQ